MLYNEFIFKFSWCLRNVFLQLACRARLKSGSAIVFECDYYLSPLNLKRSSHFLIFIFLAHGGNHNNKLTGSSTFWICVMGFSWWIYTSSKLNMSCKQKVRAESFQATLLWLEYFMDGAVYLTSCHLITFTGAKIKWPIQVVAALSFCF